MIPSGIYWYSSTIVSISCYFFLSHLLIPVTDCCPYAYGFKAHCLGSLSGFIPEEKGFSSLSSILSCPEDTVLVIWFLERIFLPLFLLCSLSLKCRGVVLQISHGIPCHLFSVKWKLLGWGGVRCIYQESCRCLPSLPLSESLPESTGSEGGSTCVE